MRWALRGACGVVSLAWMLAVAPVRADEAADQYAVAAGLYARGQWALAAEEFEAFLSDYAGHPQVPAAIFFLGETYLQQGDFDEAAAQFRRYLEHDAGGQFARAARFRNGESHYLDEDYDRAEPALRRFLDDYPDDPLGAYVLPYLGEIALSRGRLDEARELFSLALRRFPEGRLQDQCRVGWGRVLKQQGELEEAERLFLAVAAKRASPLAAEAQFLLGTAQAARGEYAEAERTFAQFETDLADSPRRAAAQLGRALALLKMERFDEAETRLRPLADEAEVGPEATYWLAVALSELVRHAEAAATLAALEVDPHHPLAAAIACRAGDALLRSGEPREALRQFEAALAIAPSEAAEGYPDGPPWAETALRGKIQALWRLGEREEAEATAGDFFSRFPESEFRRDVERVLARLLVEGEEFSRAAPLIEPLLDEGLPEDAYLLALAYRGAGRHTEALNLLAALQSADDEALRRKALLLAATTHIDREQFAEALAPLEALAAFELPAATRWRVRAQQAVCLARTGRLDGARRLAEVVLAQPGDEEVRLPLVEQLAEAVLAEGDPQWAAELFAELAASEVEAFRERGLAALGWSRLGAGDAEGGLQAFTQYLDEHAEAEAAAEVALARARLLERTDRPEAALQAYEQLAERFPTARERPQALRAAARLNEALHEHRRAESWFRRLAAEYPDLADRDVVLYEWAWVLRELDREEEAFEVWHRLRDEYPESPFAADAKYRLAVAALERGDYEVVAPLAEALTSAEADPRLREHALYLLGQLAVARGRWEEVAPPLTTLMADYPNSRLASQATFWVAEAAYRNGDYETAGERFAVLARRPVAEDEAARRLVDLRRAQVLAHQRRWGEALALAEILVEEDAGFDQEYEADYLIGRCLAALGRFDDAREAYGRVIRSPQGAKTETAAMAQWLIGESYFHQENYAAALREYLRVEILYDYPEWRSAALLQAGKCHELLDEWREAADSYRRLLDEYAETAYADEAAERLSVARDRAETAR